MPLIDDVYALLPRAGTIVGTLIPDVSVRELHTDALVITDHPVEVGAAISDHAFLMPKRLELQIGWSDASAGYVGYSREQYDALRALQAMREPFTVYTIKRRYRNMLPELIVEDTTERTAEAAVLIVRLREVIITSTRGRGMGSAPIAPNGAQANPENTGETIIRGEVGTDSFSGGGIGNDTLGATVETSVGDLEIEGIGTIPQTVPPVTTTVP